MKDAMTLFFVMPALVLGACNSKSAPKPWPEWKRVDSPREDLECWISVNTSSSKIVCAPKVVHPTSCP
jgi:hypothetical protein